jgi:Domain of unknown function (DUF4345)
MRHPSGSLIRTARMSTIQSTETISHSAERRCLQFAIGALAFIPVSIGLAGALFGPRVLERSLILSADSESLSRYLSGLLLGIGLAFLTTLPRIEREGVRFRLLTAVVFIGGLARLTGLAATGAPTTAIAIGLIMELLVTPMLAMWRERVERRAGSP